MNAGRLGLRTMDPQRGDAIAAEACAPFPRKALRVPKWGQGRLVEAHDQVELRGAKSDMVEHGELLCWLQMALRSVWRTNR